MNAASDLGARPFRTFRSVMLPLLLPSVAAGSIFTAGVLLLLAGGLTPVHVLVYVDGKFYRRAILYYRVAVYDTVLVAAHDLRPDQHRPRWPRGLGPHVRSRAPRSGGTRTRGSRLVQDPDGSRRPEAQDRPDRAWPRGRALQAGPRSAWLP